MSFSLLIERTMFRGHNASANIQMSQNFVTVINSILTLNVRTPFDMKKKARDEHHKGFVNAKTSNIN